MLNRTIIIRGIVAAASLTIAVAAVAADQSVQEGLQRCAAIDDSNARLACYDALGGRDAVVAPAPAEATTSVDIVEAAANPPTNEEQLEQLGAETLRLSDKEREEIEVRARVVDCKKNSTGRSFFYFENGQVWKQKHDRRLLFKECDFNITITKDVFGYKMLPEGETRRIRISRVK